LNDGGKNTDFDNQLLEAKKIRFKEFVDAACKHCGLDYTLKIEYVDYYKSDNTKALAWIDTINQIIYVCLLHLREMHIEDIKKTAFHEVIHVFYPDHDKEFYNALDDALLENWKPENTSGLIMKTGNTRLPKIEIQPHEIDMVHCNYHLCRKELVLKQCSYCEKYYCDEHIIPRPPTMPNFDYPNKYNNWKQSNTHPCPPYYDYLCEEERIRIKKIDDAFNRMNQASSYRISRYRRYIRSNGDNYRWEPEEKEKSEDKKINFGNDIEQEKSNVRICSFCSTSSEELTRCKYCQEWFCKDHLQPKTPQDISYLRTPGGHSCKSFAEKHNEEKQKKDNLTERKYSPYEEKTKKQHNYLSDLKFKIRNIRFNKHRRSYRRLTISTGFILGLFIPSLVGFLIIYFLLPGFSAYAQYFGVQNSVLLMLYALILPMNVESIVPWIAWIASGFVGGFITKKILIPFISMYILIWVILYLLAGNLLMQYFSFFGMYNIGQIILQTLIVNLIVSLLAFGFGGWIGASISR
jgi:hypothetical protein